MARHLARVVGALLGLLVIALVLPPPASAQTPRRGGLLRIADREAPNLDPHLNISFLTQSWASMVYSQLVRYPHAAEQKHSADFSIVPDLAEKWEYKSPTVIDFTLRKGVKFHNKPPVNGREVTAEDVARTSRPSTTCGCGGRSRWPSTAKPGTIPSTTAKAASTPVLCPAP